MSATLTEPIQIDASAFYTPRMAATELGLSESSMTKARKAGELRATRRGGRTMFRGSWLIAWLTGETPETPEAPTR